MTARSSSGLVGPGRSHAHQETRTDLGALAAELERRGALAPDVSWQDAADTIYALSTDESVYLRLTRECGWTPARYAELIARCLEATLAPK